MKITFGANELTIGELRKLIDAADAIGLPDSTPVTVENDDLVVNVSGQREVRADRRPPRPSEAANPIDPAVRKVRDAFGEVLRDYL
ncbi:hypothetical protein [Corynebacterium freiburgense]|uniref:hypothetical protein n=1 Tax=Corynebacterium freiburgense TaxID=556548 RepID=UPI000416594C|nr:hypothetical protein [Corynebacterium freiburgense]WJZ03106.1 hypothetical protein CFREI_09140 [Corynebacterium freiburgense]